ncbi:hypothetical protein NVS89_09800 [Ancylobacter sp. MQZ15Z-1]|uniref:Alpha/beta hydrolase n=1 Tax=Ancylobacter mangrovi TaxID=2972472 RepID=A0A9X2PEH0_9HYPH|nr:hypothetical protein [Ancylobacter mangrovi]MCS0495391.1 hypothetical protein [Ancylobacter mangrovi]
MERDPQTDGGNGGRRLVLFLPGHDPTDMDYHHDRFVYQAGLFAALWGAQVEVSPRLDDGTGVAARWDVATHGPNWRMRTDYRILRWDDIVVALDERSDPRRLVGGFRGLWEVLVSGTARRYIKASPRYWFFFAFPFAIVALFAAGGILAGWLAGHLAAGAMPSPLPLLVGLAVAVGAFFALFHRPGRDWRLHQALDDWDLAHHYLHDRAPELEARLDRFADILVEAVRSGGHDEILLVGHSLGATLMLGVIERALAREPGLARSGTRLCLLTCGATIPKLALHPKGEKVRAAARRVATTEGLVWVEYQARHDAINFYKFHPVTLARADFDDEAPVQPLLRNANIKRMLTPEKLRRLRWHTMRIHYQFLLANERRAAYDYFMFALGPIPFAELSLRQDGPIGRFTADGALIASTTDIP